jgi:quercetin dioxygenase-like cupin family protein
MRRASAATIALIASAGCGGESSEPQGGDRGAGIGALGADARVETLARARLPARPSGPLVWVADRIALEPERGLAHRGEFAFVYARRGAQSVELKTGSRALAEGEGTALPAGVRHVHRAKDRDAVFWEIRLAAPGSPVPAGGRRLFESEPLEGVSDGAALSFLAVTVPPRGGQTTVHTHPGPELIYELSGTIDYQNALIGTRRLGPGGLEGIPPDTAVQKRNPYRRPAVFLSWFAVDPDKPFAPRASF